MHFIPQDVKIIVTGNKSPEENFQEYGMTEEERALFESPLAKQGLHPAYLLGLRPLPWAQREQDLAAQAMQEQTMERQLALEQLHINGWPGQEIAINPHVTSRFDPPRWPFAPERTVPGYVFEGAEFYKDPASIRSAVKVEKTISTWRFPFDIFSNCMGK